MPAPRDEVSTVAKTLSAMNGRNPYTLLKETMATSDHLPASTSPPVSSGGITAAARLDATDAAAMTMSAPAQELRGEECPAADASGKDRAKRAPTVFGSHQVDCEDHYEQKSYRDGAQRGKIGDACGHAVRECETAAKLVEGYGVFTIFAAPSVHILHRHCPLLFSELIEPRWHVTPLDAHTRRCHCYTLPFVR